MNDAVLPSIDLNLNEQQQQQFLHYYSPSPNHHYSMPSANRCDPLGMPQLVDSTNQPVHYMPAKTVNNNKPLMAASRSSNLNSMAQGYSQHSMSPLAMSPHNPMLNSPPMVDQMVVGQNSAANAYCKMPPQSVPISNHYDTPPMAMARYPSQQVISNHHSPSSDMNHYNQKYCTDSSESVNISGTLTHISETDNSHPHSNYVPTPPQSQPMKPSPINSNNGSSSGSSSNNMISTPRTFPQMNCTPTNSSNWNTIPPNTMSTMNAQMKCRKTNSPNNQPSAFSTRNESHFSYLDQPNADYLSITSTPVSNSQVPAEHYLMRTNKSVLNQSSINQHETPKPKPATTDTNTSIPMLGNFSKKDCITAEKRNIIIFKVLEQIIDPSTKSVLKETVIKNEEVTTSVGYVQFDLLSNSDTTTASTNSVRSPVGSSGVLGDISGFSNTKSINNLSSTNSTTSNNHLPSNNQSTNKPSDECTFDDNINKTESKTTKTSEAVGASAGENAVEKLIGSQAQGTTIDDESDEEERRQTASALLSLQSVSSANNTPIKDTAEQSKLLSGTLEINSAITSGAISSSLGAIASDLPPTPQSTEPSSQANNSSRSTNNSEAASQVVVGRLKPGIKVMAKWKDKNFYPAEVMKQLESHKWSVKFEDSANRNLFETEIIRIEHLLPKQEVMLTISGDLCIRAVIKKVWTKNVRNIEVDLEYLEDEKQFSKRHKLRDVFLNAEQGSAIQAKSKPSLGGAVFADVDLDNIVIGKRSRKQGNEAAETATGSRKNLPESLSSDNESTNATSLGKKKRKHVESDAKKGNDRLDAKISVDCTPKKVDFHAMGHYHESSLSVSPRASSLVMPPNELEKILGPLPKSSSKLFERIGFMLTSGDRNRNNLNEHESNAERSIPFDKAYLTKQILAGSGHVYDTFEELKSSGDECVLIADTYHRSVKYIQCLAAGIPISSHLWIIDSCKANKLLDRHSYILPAGFSVITHSLSSDKSTLKKSAILFRGMKFYFGSRMSANLEQLWAPVLLAAQATIVKQDENMHNIITRKMVDIIIGDATCAPELAARAKQLKIPVVSSEYIVQCLINGRKLSYDSAKCFHPDASNLIG